MTGLDGLYHSLCAVSKLNWTSLKLIHMYVLRKAYQALTLARSGSHQRSRNHSLARVTSSDLMSDTIDVME